MSLPFYHALLNRLHRHAFRAHEFHRRLHFSLRPAEQDGHDADLVVHAGLADVEHHVGERAAHLPDDRLLDLRAGGEGEPAALGIGGVAHDGCAPPAIAGTMLTSSPAFTGVSSFCRWWMFSSLRKTLTKRLSWPGALNKRVSMPGA